MENINLQYVERLKRLRDAGIITDSALAEPWIDPVSAFAGGFGATLPKALAQGGSALARPFISGAAGAVADYPLGFATEGVEKKVPALAVPFNIAAGMVGGGVADNVFQRGFENAGRRLRGEYSPMRNPLANEAGVVGDANPVNDLADMKRYEVLGLDKPMTARDSMTAQEELSTLVQGPKSQIIVQPEVGDLNYPRDVIEIIKANKNDWFKKSLGDPNARAFMNRMEQNRAKSAIHPNSKTGLSMDFSTDCPERLAPCPYCYVEHGRGAAKVYNMHGADKTLVETPYRREILAMPQELVNKLNSHGGLRAHSFGDYRPVQDYNQWQLALSDAEAKGLYVKAITKQPEFIEAFGDHPNLRANISVDWLPREMSNSPTLKEALALKAGRDNIKVRSVALNEKQAWEMARNPDINVVTLYHASVGPDKLMKLIEKQSPGLVKKVGKKALQKELNTWENMPGNSNAFKRLAKAFPGKICCQSGKCGGDPTKCGFGLSAAGGLIPGVIIPELINNNEDDSASSGDYRAGI